MSRRQSRVTVDTRQTDTLQEFETFKKKFLLANKHITKLNSTLSVRIEELNAQISTLYVENLRLRASEIALTAQLKKEREKSRKMLADAEAATYGLMKQLGLIRKTFNVPTSTPDSTPPHKPPQTRPRRPVYDPDASPPPNRIARPPNVPGILEEDEMEIESPGYQNNAAERVYSNIVSSPTPSRRKKSRASSSGASGRQTGRVPSPPPPLDVQIANFDEEIGKAGKRKPTRRQSGLLATSMSITTVTPKGFSTEVIPPRPSSPAFGSPLRLEAALQEEEEAMANDVDMQEYMDMEEPLAVSVTRREKKRKSKEREKDREEEEEEERDVLVEQTKTDRGKRKVKDTVDDPGSPLAGKKPKLKDVTNAPPPRPSLLSMQERDRGRSTDTDQPMSATSSSSSYSSARAFLTTSRQDDYLPTPRASSPTPPPSELDGTLTGGRERRVRKSVNYTEPKLNTKLRKPDPPPTEQKKRPSSVVDRDSAPRRSTSADDSAPPPSTSSSSDSMPPTSSSITGVKRKKSRAHVAEEDESNGTQADAEAGHANVASWTNVNSRRRSHAVAGSSARRLETDEGRRHSIAV